MGAAARAAILAWALLLAAAGAVAAAPRGEHTTHAAFASALGLRFVPVVAFFGADGAETAERLVGFRTADWYGPYLDRRIADARSRVLAR